MVYHDDNVSPAVTDATLVTPASGKRIVVLGVELVNPGGAANNLELKLGSTVIRDVPTDPTDPRTTEDRKWTVGAVDDPMKLTAPLGASVCVHYDEA